jgi:hypothetical protein
MNPLTANFCELYQRHLCRHSQYGINAIHFAALVGTYVALFQLAFWMLGSWWVIPAVAIPYVAVVTPNIPFRLRFVVLGFLAGFFPAITVIPPSWPWVDVVLLVFCYWLQNWSHRWYPVEFDMTRFNMKYHKGPALFVLLTLYEMPIQLNYLVFPSTRRFENDRSEEAPTSWSPADGFVGATTATAAPSSS